VINSKNKLTNGTKPDNYTVMCDIRKISKWDSINGSNF
jgi:hypothetical protein